MSDEEQVSETTQMGSMEQEAEEKMLRSLSETHETFSYTLYKILQENQGNVVFSPLATELVLVMTLLGTKGNTSREISTALRLPQEPSLILNSFKVLLQSLQTCRLMTLEIVRNLWVHWSIPIKDEFQTTARDVFLSEVQAVDFKKDTKSAAKYINKWVAKKTHDRLKDIVPKGALHHDSGMVLTSGIYLQGIWLWPFTKNETTMKPFHVSKTTSRSVAMMCQVETFNYVDLKKIKARVLRLPFSGKNVSMLLFVPYDIDGISKMERKMSRLNITDIIKSMKNKEVELWLPKFKFETVLDLKDSLLKLGMLTMFDSTFDFSGLTETSTPLTVSHVLQKVIIDVNEYGCDALEPGTPMAKFCCWSPPKPFHVDRPFMFTIVDIPSSAMLYMGRLTDPGVIPAS